ncbi:DNA glycosylase [Coemansia mojavensis]|nr:DNA glycosylase [Coemansia mojavensis]
MSLPRDDDSDSSFVSLCKSVIFQQLAGSAARAILLKFLKRFGTLKDQSLTHFVFPSPQAVVSMDHAELKAVGLSQRKAEYLQAVAERFNNGTLSDELLVSMSDSQVSEALVSIRGIGQRTADMFMMFYLKRPNILPTLDLAVRKAMCHHFKVPFGKRTPTHNQMVEMANAWEPYRSVATWYMWRLAGTITQKD